MVATRLFIILSQAGNMHFLKKIELNGFKSFAGRTVLEFPSGITAIVGPNGSGKSNVVDAIRWLLGEREARNLRGGKVEDLIFAGTPSRPKQGLAQASLHFENSRGFFPVDFTEVSIMREVSRNGNNRYFLNKSEIRLKDLVDFFARVKLGTKGLTVVTQGNSDVFIRSTPIERREMLEEMIGLREYQIKKTRALNQLKNTDINLEKVKALIQEITPHLRSLRRQTGRWEKRDALKSELNELENNFFGSQLSYLNKETAAIEKEIQNHKNELRVFEEARSKAEDKQKAIETFEPKEREELKKIRIQTQDLLMKQSHLQKELGRLEAQLELHKEAPKSSEVSLARLTSLMNRVRDNLKAKLEGDIEDLKKTIRELLKEIESVLESKGGDNFPAALKSKFESLNQELQDIEKNLVNLKEREKHFEKSQEHFYHAFKNAITEVEAAKNKIEEWESHNQKRLFEKERLELRYEEIRRQINGAGRKPEEFSNFKSGLDLSARGLESGSLREIERKIFKLRGDLASIGEVDETIMKEAKETEERHAYLVKELEDIEKAQKDLKDLISELTEKIKVEFNEALIKINKEFNNFFRLMFDGGHARLKIKNQPRRKVGAPTEASEKYKIEEQVGEEVVDEEEENKNEGGIEVDLNLPRKKIKSLEVLSGGERSLVGIAAIFALISVSPPPFLVLDEIDAPLDDKNTRRFSSILKEFSKKTQFIVVTHNRATMEVADVLYGVTLNPDGTSKILSIKLEPTS